MQALAYASQAEFIEIGLCEGIRVLAQGRMLDVRIPGGDRVDALVEAECLDQVEVQSGDRVLMLRAPQAVHPVVIGTLGAGRAESVRLASGYRADPDGACLKLADPDGRVVLEIDTSGGAPRVKPVESDLSLEMEGRFRLEARSIELRSRLGDVTVEANDDFIARGERIRLN